jgi:DNA replication protein DnaC
MSTRIIQNAQRAPSRDSCGVCYGGFLLTTVTDDEGKRRDFAHACLCGLGHLKRKHCDPADSFLTREDILDLWPEGIPTTAGPVTVRYQLAHVPPAFWTYTLDSFKQRFGKEPGVKDHLGHASSWLAAPLVGRTDVVLYGPPGTGKTGLSTAMLLAAITNGDGACWVERPTLMDEWRECFRDTALLTERQLLDRYTEVGVLLIDDAAQGRNSEFVQTTLMRIIERRHQQQRPTLLTLNLPLTDETGRRYTPADYGSHLLQVFGDALFDRLRAHAQFWPLLGKSKRPALKLLPFPSAPADPDDGADS